MSSRSTSRVPWRVVLAKTHTPSSRGSATGTRAAGQRRALPDASRFHLARCVASMRLLHPLLFWRVRLMHPGRPDYHNVLGYVSIQLQDYDILLGHEPDAADSTTVPCIMPTWRDPTFRLSGRQRRWMHVLGTAIRATVAKCLHGAPLSISAQGVAALAGPASIAFVEPENEAATVAADEDDNVQDQAFGDASNGWHPP